MDMVRMTARNIADGYPRRAGTDPETVREYCDHWTAQELDTLELDILTDAVMTALRDPRK